MMYAPWDMECDRWNFFCTFTPLTGHVHKYEAVFGYFVDI